ncbi:MAG: hypothetical protein ABL982_05960 [Vicinamibacterales bacterium]
MTVMSSKPQPWTEVRVGGDDGCPETTAAAILSAYIHAEQVRTFSRLLLRRLAMLALAWLGISRGVLMLDWGSVLVGAGVLAAGGLYGRVNEYRAASRLRALLAGAVPASPR